MPITPCFDPTTGASGGAAPGGGSPVTPPAPTSESTTAGVNFAAKTFGAFTDPDGVISSYAAVTTNSTGTASWSGTGLGPYSATSSDGDAGTLSLNARDSGGQTVATAVHSYDRAAAAGAGWSTIHEVDFTSDITDLTLVNGAGDTNLLAGDGVTVKAVLGFDNRISTPSATAECTAASGKLLLTSDSTGSSSRASYVYVKFTEAGTGVDWSDSSKTFAIDLVLSGQNIQSNGDVAFIALGTSSAGIGGGVNYGLRHDRDSATDYNQAGRRFDSGAINGSIQNSQATVQSDMVVRLLINVGAVGDCYWQTGTTTRLSGFPTAGGGVFKSFIGVRGLSVEQSPETKFGATFYLLFDALTTSSNDLTIGINSIRFQVYA
jgi:hypothetical protein